MLFLAHWFACIWHLIVVNENDGYNWLTVNNL